MEESRRAWVVWAAGLSAYVVAVLHRTSFGVAGLEAADRFAAPASVLAGFTVLQLLMYAGLQVPVGVLLDRYGSRRMVVTGAVVMAAGQLVLALATSVPLAVAGRMLVGAGDAATFISVLRLVTAWFPARRIPVLTQVTGLTGQLGQVLSAVPLVALLNLSGWTAAFGSAAAVGVLVAAVAAAVIHDSPHGRSAPARHVTWSQVRHDVVTCWLHPGTRLGLWTHFVTQFPGTVFALMWGYPFLVSAEGITEAGASTLFTVFVISGILAGPLIGVLVQRHPLRRSWLVLGVVAANAGAWTLVIAWPGRSPAWLLLLLVLALSVGGPGSMIGFDFARTFTPENRLGTATGIVNVGGFVASLTTILTVGVLLDLSSAAHARAGTFTLDDFRLAMAAQYPVWVIGVIGVLRTRWLVRRRTAGHGADAPAAGRRHRRVTRS